MSFDQSPQLLLGLKDPGSDLGLSVPARIMRMNADGSLLRILVFWNDFMAFPLQPVSCGSNWSRPLGCCPLLYDQALIHQETFSVQDHDTI